MKPNIDRPKTPSKGKALAKAPSRAVEPTFSIKIAQPKAATDKPLKRGAAKKRSKGSGERIALPRGGKARVFVSFIDPDLKAATMAGGVTAHDVLVAGVSGHALGEIVRTFDAVPQKYVLEAIGVSERTAHRIKGSPDKRLDRQVSDGIYRLESIRSMAADVLGSVEAANDWLSSEAMGLEFRKPIELLSTSPGAEAVKLLLQRMKYGVYA